MEQSKDQKENCKHERIESNNVPEQCADCGYVFPKEVSECCKKCSKNAIYGKDELPKGKVWCADCSCHSPKEQHKTKLTCLSLDCPERKGGECNADERMEKAQQEEVMDWEKELEINAKKLSLCADVMPEGLSEHQNRIYNACLDMIYLFRKVKEDAEVKIVKKIASEIASEFVYADQTLASSGEMGARNVMLHRLRHNILSLINKDEK